MLRTQWWFKGYDKYKSKTDLCRWSGAYKKETCMWHPFGRSIIRRAYQCHHFPNDSSARGRDSHPYTIGGVASRALKGAGDVIHRNRIPGRLLKQLLRFAK